MFLLIRNSEVDSLRGIGGNFSNPQASSANNGKIDFLNKIIIFFSIIFIMNTILLSKINYHSSQKFFYAKQKQESLTTDMQKMDAIESEELQNDQ